jgi:hypothetical protein
LRYSAHNLSQLAAPLGGHDLTVLAPAVASSYLSHCCLQARSHGPCGQHQVPVAIPGGARHTVPAAASTTCGMTLLAAFQVSASAQHHGAAAFSSHTYRRCSA